MSTVQIIGGSLIDYSKLKDYHFTAKIRYEYLFENSNSLTEDFEFQINVEAQSEENGVEIYGDYLRKLLDLNVLGELGHLIYITQSILNHEGNYAGKDIDLDRQLIHQLDGLQKMIGLREEAKSIEIEFSHKAYGKQFDNYIKLNDVFLNENILDGAIQARYEQIKNDSRIHHVHLVDEIRSLDYTSKYAVEEFKRNVPVISDRAFKTNILFTVCETLKKFLSCETSINPDNVNMTNDMARIIYATCKISGLIPLVHEIERDEIDYIRAVIRNNSSNTPVIFKTHN